METIYKCSYLNEEPVPPMALPKTVCFPLTWNIVLKYYPGKHLQACSFVLMGISMLILWDDTITSHCDLGIN